VMLEIAVDLGLIGHPVAREEGGQRQFREDHELGAGAVRPAQQRAEALDHRLTAVGEVDWAQLGDGGAKLTGHGGFSFRGTTDRWGSDEAGQQSLEQRRQAERARYRWSGPARA